MSTCEIAAPAKINLSLQVLGRRPDGYHLLDSIVAPIDLFDVIRVEIDRSQQCEVRIDVVGEFVDIPVDGNNLACRAATDWLRACNVRAGVSIVLEKRIPAGSGLGGGSSDAAAVLRGLNAMAGDPLSQSELAEVALGLGADVPFFLKRRPSRMRGIGEQLEYLPAFPELDVVVCWREVPLSTREVFAAYDRALTTKCVVSNISPFVGDIRSAVSILSNDLEAAAGGICPEVFSLKQKVLALGASGALMTGSGSAVFGICATAGAAEIAAKRLRDDGCWAVAVRTLMGVSDEGTRDGR